MKLSEAARTWAESKRELERLRPRLEAAAEVLKSTSAALTIASTEAVTAGSAMP